MPRLLAPRLGFVGVLLLAGTVGSFIPPRIEAYPGAPITVQFADSTFTRALDASTTSVTVPVTLAGGPVASQDITFRYTVDGGTEQTGTISAGQTSTLLSIPATNDPNGGQLTVNLQITAVAPPGSLGTPSTATLTLMSTPVSTVSFVAATFSVDSGTAIDIWVARTGSSAIQSQVTLAASDGVTPPPPGSYTPTSGTIIFAANSALEKFTIETDSFSGQDGEVNLALSNPSAGTVLGAQSSAKLTIRADNRPSIQFSATTYSVIASTHSQINIVVTATLPTGASPPTQPATVMYSTSNGTATAGIDPSTGDYEATSGTITFSPGDFATSTATASFPITIFDHEDLTAQRTVNLALSTFVNATLGSPINATLTIQYAPSTNDVTIQAISPSPIILGQDAQITYRVKPGVALQALRLEVTNRAGVLVFASDGLPLRAGKHLTIWPAAKWNQPPQSGAFANPLNGPYSVQLKGTLSDTSSTLVVSNVKTVGTLLVLEGDLEDDKPGAGEIASGLYRPALVGNSSERMQVGLILSSGGAPTFATVAPSISQIVEADLDNDPSNGLEVKSAHFRQVMPSTFSNGKYSVVIKNLRDLADNRGVQGAADDGVIPDWVIELR